MADTFKFELVSPERVLLSENAEQVVLPGAQGDFAVLVNHAPLLAMLRPGVLAVQLPGRTRRVFVKGGFAEVEPDRLTVLAQTAFDADASSAVAAELAISQAELDEAEDDEARFMAQEAVDRLRALQAGRA
ncbi:MAG: ATP synthase F1 subunit epsilon [Hyphomicrobiaceae bacterium]|nr:ATP synthase F1 subunit epsilon [Hyphomicrobiaceae bacterium]